jgi:hypothetical protein
MTTIQKLTQINWQHPKPKQAISLSLNHHAHDDLCINLTIGGMQLQVDEGRSHIWIGSTASS